MSSTIVFGALVEVTSTVSFRSHFHSRNRVPVPRLLHPSDSSRESEGHFLKAPILTTGFYTRSLIASVNRWWFNANLRSSTMAKRILPSSNRETIPETAEGRLAEELGKMVGRELAHTVRSTEGRDSTNPAAPRKSGSNIDIG